MKPNAGDKTEPASVDVDDLDEGDHLTVEVGEWNGTGWSYNAHAELGEASGFLVVETSVRTRAYARTTPTSPHYSTTITSRKRKNSANYSGRLDDTTVRRDRRRGRRTRYYVRARVRRPHRRRRTSKERGRYMKIADKPNAVDLDTLIDDLDRVPIWRRLPPRPLSPRELVCALPEGDTTRDVYIGVNDTDGYDHRVEDIDEFVLTSNDPNSYTHIHFFDYWNRITTSVTLNKTDAPNTYNSPESEIGDRFITSADGLAYFVSRVGEYNARDDEYKVAHVVDDVGKPHEWKVITGADAPAIRISLAKKADAETGRVYEYDPKIAERLDMLDFRDMFEQDEANVEIQGEWGKP